MIADDWKRLRHMVDAYQEAIQLLGDRDIEALEKNLLVRKGLLQWMEIGADAAKNIGHEVRDPAPHLPWDDLCLLPNPLSAEPEDAARLHALVSGQMPTWVAALQALLAS